MTYGLGQYQMFGKIHEVTLFSERDFGLVTSSTFSQETSTPQSVRDEPGLLFELLIIIKLGTVWLIVVARANLTSV